MGGGGGGGALARLLNIFILKFFETPSLSLSHTHKRARAHHTIKRTSTDRHGHKYENEASISTN